MTTLEQTFLSFLAQLKEDIKREVLDELSTTDKEQVNYRMNVEEAVEYLKISKETIYRLCKEKQIEHIVVGVAGSRRPRILFQKSTLDRWLDMKEKESVQGTREPL